MKKICLIIFSIAFALNAFALDMSASASDTTKNPTVPKDILTDFAKKHPNAKLSTWTKSNHIYIVSYREDNMNLWSTYDSNGQLLENKWKVSLLSLPATTQDYIKKNTTQGILEYYKINDASGSVFYEVSTLHKSFIFDSEGAHIKTIESLRK